MAGNLSTRMRTALLIRCIVPILCLLGGCAPSWQSQFPTGTRLYEQSGERYFGRVIAFDARHDFHNGEAPYPAVLIEQADGGEKVWGACATCAATFQVNPPQ